MRNMTGPDGVESLDSETPVGGRNLIKASHWQFSLLRSHLRHVGRVSSPMLPSEDLLRDWWRRKDAKRRALPTLLAFPATV
jgi:hypothetical protein